MTDKNELFAESEYEIKLLTVICTEVVVWLFTLKS